MKTFKILILSFLMIALAGCSSDDDNSSSTDATMIGVWYPTMYKIEGEMQMEGMGQIEYIAEGAGDFDGISVEFKENGTYVAQNSEFPLNITVKLNGQVISSEQVQASWDFIDGGEWLQEGNMVNISNSQENVNYEIIQLTSSRLKMQTDEGSIEDDGGEIPSDMEMTITLEFKR